MRLATAVPRATVWILGQLAEAWCFSRLDVQQAAVAGLGWLLLRATLQGGAAAHKQGSGCCCIAILTIPDAHQMRGFDSKRTCCIAMALLLATRRRRRRREVERSQRAAAAAAESAAADAAAAAGGLAPPSGLTSGSSQQAWSSTVDALALQGGFRPPNPELSTLALTTGTRLMLEVHASLAAYICNKLADPATAHLRWAGRHGLPGPSASPCQLLCLSRAGRLLPLLPRVASVAGPARCAPRPPSPPPPPSVAQLRAVRLDGEGRGGAEDPFAPAAPRQRGAARRHTPCAGRRLRPAAHGAGVGAGAARAAGAGRRARAVQPVQGGGAWGCRR